MTNIPYRTMKEWDEVFNHLNRTNTTSKAAQKRPSEQSDLPKPPKPPKIVKEEPADEWEDHQGSSQMDQVHQPQQRHSNHQRHQNYQDHQNYNDVHNDHNWQFEESHDNEMFHRRSPNGPRNPQNRLESSQNGPENPPNGPRMFFNQQNRPQPLMSLDFPKRK